MIDEIANPRPVLTGETYDGTVVKTTTFGAFVNLARVGTASSTSKLGKGKRLNSVEEAVKEGDTLTVLVEDIDAQGKISLRPVGAEWEAPEGSGDGGAPRATRAPRAPNGDRGPRRHGRRFATTPRRVPRASRDPEALIVGIERTEFSSGLGW